MLPDAPAVSIYHQNDTIGSRRNERDFMAEFEFPLWLDGQRTAREKVANLTAELLDADMESLRLLAAGQLRDALWDVVMNRNEVALYTQKLVHASQLEADVKMKYEAGELAKTDWMLAQQETLSAEKSLVRAQAELMHANFRYRQLTGIQETPEHFIEQKSVRSNFLQSPIWRAAESRLKKAQGDRDLTHIERRENPQVILNVRDSQGAFDMQYNQSVGVRVKIPLNSAVRSASLLAASEQLIGDVMADRESLLRQLETQLHEAEHNLEVSEMEIKIAKHQAEIAKENARLARIAYASGELDLTNLLRIQAQSFEADRSYTNREIEMQWNIARYNQAVGELPANVLSAE